MPHFQKNYSYKRKTRKYGGHFMSTDILYEGFFISPENQLPGTLEHVMKYQHITTSFNPKYIHEALWGKKAKISFVGYRNDGIEEGYQVFIHTDDADLQEQLQKLIVPYIVVSVSKESSYLPEKTWDMEHIEIEAINPELMPGIEVTFGAFSKNFKEPLFQKLNQEVYIEPRYGFHDTADVLYAKAISKDITDVACLCRLREILYNEQKYELATIVGYLRDGAFERQKYSDFNVGDIKAAIKTNQYLHQTEIPFHNKLLEIEYQPNEGTVYFKMINPSTNAHIKTTLTATGFCSKDRKEINDILDDLEYQFETQTPDLESDEIELN